MDIVKDLKKLYIKHNFRLNTSAVNKFTQKCDSTIKSVIKKIIDNTKYVSFNDFIVQLNKALDAYLEVYIHRHIHFKRPIFICREADPTKQWLYNYVNMYFVEKVSGCELTFISAYPGGSGMEVIRTYKLRKDDVIIFLDDCMYSGAHIGSLMNMFRFVNSTVDCYILVPYGSEQAKQAITGAYNYETIERQNKGFLASRNLIFCREIFIYKTMSDVLNIDELDLLSKYYPQDLLSLFPLDSPLSLIYFDHKLADYGSVPAIIYLGVVANVKNAYYFKTHPLRSISNFPEFSRNLDIIPIINNCSSYTSELDLDNPKCPSRPDSEGFDTFVSQLSSSSVGGRKKTTSRRGRPRKTT